MVLINEPAKIETGLTFREIDLLVSCRIPRVACIPGDNISHIEGVAWKLSSTDQRIMNEGNCPPTLR